VPDPSVLRGFGTPHSRHGQRPLTLMLDTTNKCNLRCVMCHFAYPSAAKEPLQKWDLDFLAKLEREVLPHVQHAQLSLGTEPLVWKHFPDLLDACKRAGVPVIDMYTNAVLLTEELARKIVSTPMTRVQLSLEGVSRRGFDEVRAGATFEEFERGVQLLVRARAEVGSQLPRLQFNVTLLRRNAGEIEDIVRLAHRWGIDFLDFRHVVVHDGLGMEQESFFGDKPGFNRLMKRVRALAAELDVAIYIQPPDFQLEGEESSGPVPGAPLVQDGPFEVGRVSEPVRRELPLCLAPWQQFFVRPDRSVVPCTFWYTQDRMGDLERQSFGEIWDGEPYRRLRHQLLTGNYGVNCAQCPLRGIGSVEDERAHRSNSLAKAHLLSDGTPANPDESHGQG